MTYSKDYSCEAHPDDTGGVDMSDKLSPRKELDAYLGSGNLREAISRHNSTHPLGYAAIELLIDIVGRYCAPRRKRKK